MFHSDDQKISHSTRALRDIEGQIGLIHFVILLLYHIIVVSLFGDPLVLRQFRIRSSLSAPPSSASGNGDNAILWHICLLWRELPILSESLPLTDQPHDGI